MKKLFVSFIAIVIMLFLAGNSNVLAKGKKVKNVYRAELASKMLS